MAVKKCNYDFETAKYFVALDGEGSEIYLCDECAMTAEDSGYETEDLED